MQNSLSNLPNRRHAKAAVSAILGLLLGGLFVAWWIGLISLPVSLVDQEHGQSANLIEQETNEQIFKESEPVRLRVPAVAIDTVFEESLGLDESGAIEVPENYDTVGWYHYGPTPGELGPAVVIGHVDSYEGPAVFYSLGQLEIGAEVFIDRADGSTAVFEVTEFERPSQSEFPTEKVYGDIDHSGLRLITCTGTYDHGTERYSHNLIVYGKLVRMTEAKQTE